MGLLFFFKFWEFVCLHCSFSSLSQSHKFRSRCPTLTLESESHYFLANVNYVTFAICHRLSTVVCNVGAPYSAGWNFPQFFHHTIAQGSFLMPKSLVGDAPFPLKFAFNCMGYRIYWLSLCDPTFAHFGTVRACDGRPDMTTAGQYTALG